MMEAVDACPAPLVARAHGFALGGGSGLAACADAVVAAPDATFGFTEVRLGIAPAVISPFVPPKIAAHAPRDLPTGGRVRAPTAPPPGPRAQGAGDRARPGPPILC